MKITQIKKRNGAHVSFDEEKIISAIEKAMIASGEIKGTKDEVKTVANESARRMAAIVTERLEQKDVVPCIEGIQDTVEDVLMDNLYRRTARAYITYRAQRAKVRDSESRLMREFSEIVSASKKDSDLKRENANVDADTAMGSMLKFGSQSAKHYYLEEMIEPRFSRAHEGGDIHMHDLDFYSLTLTCCQISLRKLFKDGFNTGHGSLREPQGIASYSSLCCIAIQANQNDMHGGQSVYAFDYDMSDGVRKTFKKEFRKKLSELFADMTEIPDKRAALDVATAINSIIEEPALVNSGDYDDLLASELTFGYKEYWKGEKTLSIEDAKDFIEKARKRTEKDTDRQTYQAMESLIHNLNTMHSRAGAQTPFSSINYGTDTSPEGRMVIRNILLATEAGLGNGEIPIFPIQIFKLKQGINYSDGDPNYDLFQLSLRVTSKRMFPNYAFIDAPFNLQYYVPNHPETEVAYMGCRTRVIGNVYDPSRQTVEGRGNNSFTSINLPRIGILAKGSKENFFNMLEERMNLVADQLLERMEVQSCKKAKNFPMLMQQGVWLDSENLSPDDEIREVIKHGTLTIGFIGLAETLKALIGKHHGESAEAQELGLQIIGFMRAFCNKKAQETGLNFSLIATPAEGLSGRFVNIDKKLFGIIEGVTDKEYYTNSFHVPVSFPIGIYDKLKIEGPYHEMTNAGHISYIEVDGDTTQNITSLESIVKAMGACGVGYGAINHPIDTDPICGYDGVIYDVCPRCGRHETPTVPFVRIRRITGYLVGTLDRFNNAKLGEVKDRVCQNVGA